MYTDLIKEKSTTAVLPNGQYVYGTESEIQYSQGTVCSYEEGVEKGNDWDSLSQPRKETTAAYLTA